MGISEYVCDLWHVEDRPFWPYNLVFVVCLYIKLSKARA